MPGHPFTDDHREARMFTKEMQLRHHRSKPYRRRVASRKTWERLRDERLGPCLVCTWHGRTQAHVSTLHHVVPKDALHRGDDVAENLVPLCGDGVTGCHGRVEARDAATMRALAEAVQALEPAVYAYAVEKLGEHGWLRLYGVTFS